MIVKILFSARNFAGVQYNERKNDTGKSELLVARNFGALGNKPEVSRMDYVRYMKAVSALNPRVVNRQFHAMISVKGTEYPLDKLAGIGVSFLEKMGYGNNPYLIYHHSDTGNTHIHLVSTRVDKQGQKVDDAFEKIRSQKVMQEILSLDPAYEAKTTMEKALGYRYSTEAQFRLLLERQGYIVREKEGRIEVIRYGVVQGSVDKAAVQERIKGYYIDENRRNQLKAWMLKYAMGKSREDGMENMKRKFGVELVYHQTKGQENPYGYTLIDHKDKILYKGSQILGIRELLPKENNDVDAILQKASKNNWSITELAKVLNEAGWKLHSNGEIHSGSEKRQLAPESLNTLYYHERRQLADSFAVNDTSCKAVLTDWLGLRKDDIHPTSINQNESEAHRAVMAYLDQTKKWEEGLDHFHYSILRHQGQTFLLSTAEPAMMNLDKLMGRSLSYPESSVQTVRTDPEVTLDQQATRLNSTNLLQVFLQILADSQRSTTNDQQKRKSFKR